MGRSGEIEQFAAYLRMLKDRTGRSFDALGRRAGVSGSSLHRYCAGTSVPPDYGVVQAFAKVCGANRQELRELHRLWAIADASRETLPGGARDGAAEEPTDAGGEPSTANGEPSAVATVGRTTVAAADQPAPAPDRRRPRPAIIMVAAALTAVLLGAAAWATSPFGDSKAGAPESTNGRLLFTAACQPVVSMGQHDECAREVQNLLKQAGGKLGVDGDFGPETLKRVTAFQVLAGLPPKGVVDEATKRALYEQRVKMTTWSPEQVSKRIREVFPEEPDRAVAIADCQSFLDPLWVLPNTNGSRNWGVFQISDSRLKQFNGTPLKAFDPEWNIQVARQLWSLHKDFRDWPNCDRAAAKSQSPGPGVKGPTSPAPGASPAAG